MADEKIMIDGDQYISSSRAARLVGYTKDYVGQLARAGKIKGTRVGRNWYISEDSINKHKVSVHYTLTKPKKSRTEKSDNDEKAIKNKDISSTSTRDTSTEKIKTTPKEDASEEAILFPKIRKAARDPLLDSDIRYEEHEVMRAKKIDPAIKQQTAKRARQQEIDTISVRNTFKQLPIRDIRPQKSEYRRAQTKPDSRTNQTGNPAIDGIILSKKPQGALHNKRPTRPLPQNEPQMKDTRGSTESRKVRRPFSEPTDMVEEIHEQPIEQADNSKIFPVVGGILVFTVVTVIYILFFMGS